MSGISVHAVDVAAGIAAEGMRIEILCLSPEPHLIAEGHLDGSGLFDNAVTRRRLEPGPYEVRLHIGAYLGTADQGFLDVAPFRFRVTDPDHHVHLPMKFTAWGYSLFRGS